MGSGKGSVPVCQGEMWYGKVGSVKAVVVRRGPVGVGLVQVRRSRYGGVGQGQFRFVKAVPFRLGRVWSGLVRFGGLL